MSFFEPLFLGIIQGITEFFPISSSAHLKLLKLFFNDQSLDSSHLFDLSCHLGTLAASIIFLRKEIQNTLKNERSNILLFCIAILPIVPAYFLLKPLREYFSQIRFLPFFLFFTALILFVSSRVKIKEKEEITYKRKIKDVLLIGIMQALALIPGLSRSGWTITSGYFRGWKIQESIKFSFLLAIPTIIGGSILESLKHVLKSSDPTQVDLSSYLIGFISSFIVGFFAIRFIFSITSHKSLRFFAWYLFGLAIFSLIYLKFIM